MSAEAEQDAQFEIAHILLIDVVGYSTLLGDEQIDVLRQLNQIVRGTPQFQRAEKNGQLIRLPTGDGMALLFFRSPEEPAQCALEISRALVSHPQVRVRMGAHSGPVSKVTDVNDRSNVTGAGINLAQRVMDCGDAGHILLSKHLANDLAEYRHWRPHLYDLGECEVKHGLRLHVVNLYKDNLGNPEAPAKFRIRGNWRRAAVIPDRTKIFLRRTVLAAAFLGAIALAIGVIISNYRASRHVPTNAVSAGDNVTTNTPKSVAVLPFENLSDERENAYFTDGVHDEILTRLSKVADLKVISRTSVMQYRDKNQRNLRDIGQMLKVAYVVEGTVQRESGRVRVSAQLIDAHNDSHVWADHYDRDITNVFDVESEIAGEIVSNLKATLSSEEKVAMKQNPTADLVAYTLYLRARNLADAVVFGARRKENLFQAIRLLDQAVAGDPNFFLAWCELARKHDYLYLVGIDHTPARLALADNAIQTAFRVRPDAGEGHLARAYHFYSLADYPRASDELARAQRTLPNEMLVFELRGYMERRQGHWEQSVVNLKRAVDLDPLNVNLLKQLSLSYEPLRQFADMAAALDRALLLAPEDNGTRVQRAVVDLEWHADTHPLHATIEQLLTLDRNNAADVAFVWLYLALCERDSAAAALALAALPPDGCRTEGIAFPHAWCEGVVARTFGKIEAASAAFAAARTEVEKTVREQPDYAQAVCILGMLDAALGNKEQAVKEGRRAIELLPLSKDAINGALVIEYLALIYAWTGDNDQAIEQLTRAARIPSDVCYGQLRLHPIWDPLRNDPRFEKIVASLAPGP